MSRTLCKSIKKNGSPCQGNGLKQFDSYCIAHGPADKVRQWRSRGGKNSATAARLDKRIPARLKDMMDMLDDGMKRLLDGTLTPAAYTAICRGAKVRIDLYRLADKEMKVIRTEETQAAARNRRRSRQPRHPRRRRCHRRPAGPVPPRVARPPGSCRTRRIALSGQPSGAVLTLEGRRQLGYNHSVSSFQEEIDELKDSAPEYRYQHSQLPEMLQDVTETGEAVEVAPATIKRQPALPRDSLTGEPFNGLPALVTHDLETDDLETEEHVHASELSPELLECQRC